jgi:hypothetical protein
MATGRVNRVKRPNTWLHRPMLQSVKKALANPGAVHTWLIDAAWFGQRHMPVVTMAMRTVVPRTALAVLWRELNLRQGTKMASQLELRSRAALCIQLANREPANRVLWIAEAESWSRQSNKNFAASQSKHQAADSRAIIASKADRNPPAI